MKKFHTKREYAALIKPMFMAEYKQMDSEQQLDIVEILVAQVTKAYTLTELEEWLTKLQSRALFEEAKQHAESQQSEEE